MTTDLFETTIFEDEPYRLVWLHIGGRQYRKPTLKELKDVVEIRQQIEEATSHPKKVVSLNGKTGDIYFEEFRKKVKEALGP